MTARLFAIVAEVAAKHALAARTKVRIDLCYEADRTPSHARVVFGDQQNQERCIMIDISPAMGASDAHLNAYRQLVDRTIERFRWRNRRPAA